MTEKDLIRQLQGLKEIKPNQQWASLLKSQLFAEPVKEKIGNWEIGKFIGNWKLIIENSFAKRLAYSFAAFVFVVAGLIGFASYTAPGDLLFSTADLSGKTELERNAKLLASQIDNLTRAAGRDNSAVIAQIKTNALQLTKSIKQGDINNPETIKEIAASLKVLADVPGTSADVVSTSAVKDLYQTIVESQIADLEKATLSTDQKILLEEVKVLYQDGKYVEALEKILSI